MKSYKSEIPTDEAITQLLSVQEGQPFEIVQILEIDTGKSRDPVINNGSELPRFAVFVAIADTINNQSQRLTVLLELFAHRLYQLQVYIKHNVSFFDIDRINTYILKELRERDGYEEVWRKEGWKFQPVKPWKGQ